MRSFALILLAAITTSLSAQQAPNPTLQQHAPVDATTTLRATTQLVVVDVVVQDKDGQPIHGLKLEDFTLNEDKKPQTIRHFDEHSNATAPVDGPKLPPMPPGTFTDYTSTPANGALNILLLDALNTPMKDQSYVRYELQQYVKHAEPGTRIAIFGLAQRLYILQGFSSDPETLKDAVEHKLIPRASNLLHDPVGTDTDLTDISSNLADISSSLAGFETEMAAVQTQMRLQYTIDAFNVLAHYLSAFPGRKNLIWFSGSFPIDILPDATLDNPFSVMMTNNDEFRETTNLLAKAQVAVYPIDARGLMTNPAFSAASSGHKLAAPNGLANATQGFAQSQFQEHSTMDQLAEDTGGAAFYNNNDLAHAVHQAVESGSNYYTLSYTPSNKNWNGDYRSIRVNLTGDLAAQKLKLSYRHGYYADDPNNPKQAATVTTTTEAAQKAAVSGAAYARASMARAAPTPSEILFKVRVLPATTGTETTLAPGNEVDPKKPLKPPYRRFMIDFATLTNDLKLTLDPTTHRHTGNVEFTALLYDPDGQLLNATGHTFQLNLTEETYKAFLQGIGSHLEISVPVKGESYLRIAVHDIASNKFGVVEIPITSVAKLAPLSSSPAATPTPENTPTPATTTAPAATPPTSSHPLHNGHVAPCFSQTISSKKKLSSLAFAQNLLSPALSSGCRNTSSTLSPVP